MSSNETNNVVTVMKSKPEHLKLDAENINADTMLHYITSNTANNVIQKIDITDLLSVTAGSIQLKLWPANELSYGKQTTWQRQAKRALS